MAKEEQTTIGLNKPTMALIALLITVAGFGAFWKDRGGTEAKAAATHESIVSSHETRIAANTRGIKEIRTEQHRAELARTKMDVKMDSVITKQAEMNTKQDKFIEYLMQYDYDKKKETP